MRRKPPGAMNHQRAVAARFSAAASTYDSHFAVQDTAAARVAEMVKSLPAIRRVLEIGCGTGVLTMKLAEALPDAVIDAIDVSPAMVKMAQARLAGNGRIAWIVSDVESMRSGQPFDLVVSSSSLHWITPLNSAFGSIHALLASQGHLIFSLMLNGTLGELHAARLKISPHKPAGARLPSKEEVLDALESSGFKLDSHECVSSKMEFASASQFLKHLHDQGLTGGRFSTGGIPLTKSEIGKLVSDYDSNYKTKAGGVYATYEVLYVVAQKQT